MQLKPQYLGNLTISQPITTLPPDMRNFKQSALIANHISPHLILGIHCGQVISLQKIYNIGIAPYFGNLTSFHWRVKQVHLIELSRVWLREANHPYSISKHEIGVHIPYSLWNGQTETDPKFSSQKRSTNVFVSLITFTCLVHLKLIPINSKTE